MDNQRGPRKITGERQATYYIGLALIVIGFITFFSIFISIGTAMSQPIGPGMMDSGPDVGSYTTRAVLGMGMCIVGAILMNVGSRGLAGSGVVLDPDQARKDLEPWSRMAGGMAKDALNEADIRLGGSAQEADLPFDEKLRRLEKLHADGLLTEAEYAKKRSEILGEKW